MIWAPKGSTHSIPVKKVTPRISMIMALSNDGDIYASFTQVNTTSTILDLYIKELVKTLDKEDRNWRLNTIILHDGAPYAQSSAIMTTLKKLQIPFVFLSPYSYNVAPIEMLFGAIKTGNNNPDNLPTGKT